MASITLSPTGDAWVWEEHPNENFGVTDAYFDVFTQNGSRNRRSFLKCDLSVLPPGAIITLAVLKIHCGMINSPVAGVTNVEARKVADDTWVEAVITWNNQPAYGVVVDTKVPAMGWNNFAVTGYVTAEFAGDKTVSFCLKCVTESYDATLRGPEFKSKEYATALYRPVLYIEYTVKPKGIIAIHAKLVGII